MKEIINNINDNYLEHKFHTEFDKQCSTCFSDRLKKAEMCGLSYTGDVDLNGYPEFIGTQDQWEAFDLLKFKVCKNCSIPCSNTYCDECQHQIEQDPSYFD